MPIFFAVAEYLSNMFYLSKNVILEVPAKCQAQISIHYILSFLGPRGPLVLPLVNPPARTPVRAKNLDTYIQAYMPHESSGYSSSQLCTVEYCLVQSSTAQYSLLLPSTVYYRPVQ